MGDAFEAVPSVSLVLEVNVAPPATYTAAFGNVPLLILIVVTPDPASVKGTVIVAVVVMGVVSPTIANVPNEGARLSTLGAAVAGDASVLPSWSVSVTVKFVVPCGRVKPEISRGPSPDVTGLNVIAPPVYELAEPT